MLMRREHERMTGAASAVLGGIFVIAALAHSTDGFTDDARALPSTILGLVSGIALLVAAFGLLSHRLWGWRVGVGAHVVAIVTTLISIFALVSRDGDGRADIGIPSVMLVLLVLSSIALWRARPRNPLRRMQHEVAAKMY